MQPGYNKSLAQTANLYNRDQEKRMPEVTDSKSTADQTVKPLKSTLNLPQTSFAMKANLPVNEPIRLAEWQKPNAEGKDL